MISLYDYSESTERFSSSAGEFTSHATKYHKIMQLWQLI